jgi:hypothetical protein
MRGPPPAELCSEGQIQMCAREEGPAPRSTLAPRWGTIIQVVNATPVWDHLPTASPTCLLAPPLVNVLSTRAFNTLGLLRRAVLCVCVGGGILCCTVRAWVNLMLK